MKPVPLIVSVTPGVPTYTVFGAVEVMLGIGLPPEPTSVAEWEPPPLSLAVKMPVRLPIPAGVNSSVIVQVSPAGRIPLQDGPEMPKSKAFSPVKLLPEIVTGAELTLLMNTASELDVNSATVPKFTGSGVRRMAEPVPLSAMLAVEVPPRTVSEPARNPAAVGVNATPIEQSAPAARVVKQLLLTIAKSPDVAAPMLSPLRPALVTRTL